MAEAHASLGAVLREEGRLPDAIASLEAALRLSSTLGEAHYNLGLCLEDQGDLPRAINEYRRAMQQLASDPMPALNLALALAFAAGRRRPRSAVKASTCSVRPRDGEHLARRARRRGACVQAARRGARGGRDARAREGDGRSYRGHSR